MSGSHERQPRASFCCALGSSLPLAHKHPSPLPTSNPRTQMLQALCCWREFLAEPNAPLPPTYDELLAMDMRPYPPPGGRLEGGSFEEIEVGAATAGQATGRRLKAASQACQSMPPASPGQSGAWMEEWVHTEVLRACFLDVSSLPWPLSIHAAHTCSPADPGSGHVCPKCCRLR